MRINENDGTYIDSKSFFSKNGFLIATHSKLSNGLNLTLSGIFFGELSMIDNINNHTLSLGNETKVNSGSGFLISMDNYMSYLWDNIISYNDTSIIISQSINFDILGNLYQLINYFGGVFVNKYYLAIQQTQSNSALIKYDNKGNFLWVKSQNLNNPNSYVQFLNSFITNSAFNTITILGLYSSSVSFDKINIQNSSPGDFFLSTLTDGCYNIAFNSKQVCSSNGNCNSPNNCVCNNKYSGSNCEINIINNNNNPFVCNGISSNNTKVCNGNGICTQNDICNCNNNYSGKFCDTKSSVATSRDMKKNIVHYNRFNVNFMICLFMISVIIIFE